tara:strand:- start:43 stop:666 length:624 start_codon:yes stop_codon:yes gene_type:complete
MLRGSIENSENVLPNGNFNRYWLDWLGDIINTDSSDFSNLDDYNLTSYSALSLASDGAGGRKLSSDGSSSSTILETKTNVDKDIVYDTKLTLSNVTAGTAKLNVGLANGTSRSSDGTYSEQLTASSTDSVFLFLQSSFAGNVDDVVIRPRTADQEGSYRVAVFNLEGSSGVKCQSIAFKIETSLTTAHKLHINDIQVEYRAIESQVV